MTSLVDGSHLLLLYGRRLDDVGAPDRFLALLVVALARRRALGFVLLDGRHAERRPDDDGTLGERAL